MGVVPHKELHAPHHELQSSHSSDNTTVDDTTRNKSASGRTMTTSSTTPSSLSTRKSGQGGRKSSQNYNGKARNPVLKEEERSMKAPLCAACGKEFEPENRSSKYCRGSACGGMKGNKNKRFLSPLAVAKAAAARITGRGKSPNAFRQTPPRIQQQVFSTLPWNPSPAMSGGRYDDGLGVGNDEREVHGGSPARHGASPRKQGASRAGRQRKLHDADNIMQEQRTSPQSAKSNAITNNSSPRRRSQGATPINDRAHQQGTQHLSLPESSAVDAPGNTETTSGSLKTLLGAPEVLPEKFNNDDTLLAHDYQLLDSAAENSLELSGTFGFSAGISSAQKSTNQPSYDISPRYAEERDDASSKKRSPSKCTCKKGSPHKHHRHHKHHHRHRSAVAATEEATPTRPSTPHQFTAMSAQHHQRTPLLVAEFSDTEDLFSTDLFPHLDTASKKAMAKKLKIPGEEVLEVTTGDKRDDKPPRHHTPNSSPAADPKMKSKYISLPLEMLDDPELLFWLKDRIIAESSTMPTEDGASSQDLAVKANKQQLTNGVDLDERCHTYDMNMDDHELAQLEWRDAIHGVRMYTKESRVNSGKECMRHVLIKPAKQKSKRISSARSSACSRRSGISSRRTPVTIEPLDRPVAGELLLSNGQQHTPRVKDGFVVVPTVLSYASKFVKISEAGNNTLPYTSVPAVPHLARSRKAEDFVRDVVLAPPANEFHALARREEYNMVSLFPETSPSSKLKLALSERASQTDNEMHEKAMKEEQMMQVERDEHTRQQLMLQQWLQQRERELKMQQEYHKQQLQEELEQKLKLERRIMLQELQENMKSQQQQLASSMATLGREERTYQSTSRSAMTIKQLKSPSLPADTPSAKRRPVAYYGEEPANSPASPKFINQQLQDSHQRSSPYCADRKPKEDNPIKVTEQDIAVLRELRSLLEQLRLNKSKPAAAATTAAAVKREAYTEVTEEVLNHPSVESYGIKSRASRDASAKLEPRAAIVTKPLKTPSSEQTFAGTCRRSPSRGLSPVIDSTSTTDQHQAQNVAKSGTPALVRQEATNKPSSLHKLETPISNQTELMTPAVNEAKLSLSRQRVFGAGPPDLLARFTAIPSAEKIQEDNSSKVDTSAVDTEGTPTAHKPSASSASCSEMSATAASGATSVGLATPSDTSVIEHKLPMSPRSPFGDDTSKDEHQSNAGDEPTSMPRLEEIRAVSTLAAEVRPSQSTYSAQHQAVSPVLPAAQKTASSSADVGVASPSNQQTVVPSAAAAVSMPDEVRHPSPWPELETPLSSVESATAAAISPSQQQPAQQVLEPSQGLDNALVDLASVEQHRIDVKISDFASVAVELIASNPAEDVSLTDNDNGSIQESAIASPGAGDEDVSDMSNSAVAAFLVTAEEMEEESSDRNGPSSTIRVQAEDTTMRVSKAANVGSHLTTVTAASAPTAAAAAASEHGMIQREAEEERMVLTKELYSPVEVSKPSTPAAGNTQKSDFDVRSFGFEISSPRQSSSRAIMQQSRFKNSPIGVAPVKPMVKETGIHAKTPMRTLPILTTANSLSTSDRSREKANHQEDHSWTSSSARATFSENTSKLIRSKFANLPKPPRKLDMELITSSNEEVKTWIGDLRLRPGDNIVLRGVFSDVKGRFSTSKDGVDLASKKSAGKKPDLTPKQSGVFAEDSTSFHTFGLDLWKISKDLRRQVAKTADSSADPYSNEEDTDEEEYSFAHQQRTSFQSVERAFFLNPVFSERKMLVGSSVKSEWRSTKYVAIGRNFVFEPNTPFEFVLYFRETNFMLKWKGVHGRGELIYAYVHPLKDISHLRIYGCAELHTALLFY